MLYAILAYHVEDEVASWSPEQDAALMLDLNRVHGRLEQDKRLGPAARLGATKGACVLRGKGKGVVTDGPFTETKELLRQRLRQPRRRDRDRARPAPGQSFRDV
jgi:hypothetical protein